MTMTNREKHEHAIKILDCIDVLNNRIFRNIADKEKWGNNDFLGMNDFFQQRIEINVKIREKLLNYYHKKFRI